MRFWLLEPFVFSCCKSPHHLTETWTPRQWPPGDHQGARRGGHSQHSLAVSDTAMRPAQAHWERQLSTGTDRTMARGQALPHTATNCCRGTSSSLNVDSNPAGRISTAHHIPTSPVAVYHGAAEPQGPCIPSLLPASSTSSWGLLIPGHLQARPPAHCVCGSTKESAVVTQVLWAQPGHSQERLTFHSLWDYPSEEGRSVY